jgi:glycosyltransferase involved in cell wall biosynthesis
VGRTTKNKGLSWLIENKEHWSFTWQWSGDEYFGDNSVSEIAKSFPSVPAGRGVVEMADLFSKTSVVLCPYLDEGFGMVVAEAAASGCRVVAFGQGGVLESGRAEHVTLVPPGDVVAFNDAVCAALETGTVTQEERTQAANLYSPENSVLAYRDHLRRRLGVFE